MRLPDPTHQRANGNLKYFEVQLEKQRRAETSAGGDKREKRHVDAQMKRSEDPLPERKRYEQLCRGEGLKMVRTQHLYVIVLCFFFFITLYSPRLSLSSLFAFRRNHGSSCYRRTTAYSVVPKTFDS